MDVSYGKKVKDASSRGKTSKEEWKEREASANQAVPTRVKIFEGGSVERLTIRAHLLLRSGAIPASTLHVCCIFCMWNTLSCFQVQVQRRLRVRQRSRPGKIHL